MTIDNACDIDDIARIVTARLNVETTFMQGSDEAGENKRNDLPENKVTTLKNSIVEECRNQGYTLSEYVRLVDLLRFVYEQRKKQTVHK